MCALSKVSFCFLNLVRHGLQTVIFNMPDLSSESTLDYCCNQCIEVTVKFVWKQGIKWESK